MTASIGQSRVAGEKQKKREEEQPAMTLFRSGGRDGCLEPQAAILQLDDVIAKTRPRDLGTGGTESPLIGAAKTDRGMILHVITQPILTH